MRLAAAHDPSTHASTRVVCQIATIATDRNAKIIYANPVCYRYLGYLANELVGHPIEILFPEKVPFQPSAV